MTQNSGRWFMAAMLFAALFSGCGQHASMPATMPDRTVAASTIPTASIVTALIATTGCGRVSPVGSGGTIDATIVSDG